MHHQYRAFVNGCQLEGANGYIDQPATKCGSVFPNEELAASVGSRTPQRRR